MQGKNTSPLRIWLLKQLSLMMWNSMQNMWGCVMLLAWVLEWNPFCWTDKPQLQSFSAWWTHIMKALCRWWADGKECKNMFSSSSTGDPVTALHSSWWHMSRYFTTSANIQWGRFRVLTSFSRTDMFLSLELRRVLEENKTQPTKQPNIPVLLLFCLLFLSPRINNKLIIILS